MRLILAALLILGAALVAAVPGVAQVPPAATDPGTAEVAAAAATDPGTTEVAAAPAASLTGTEILAKVEDRYIGKTSKASMKMVLVSKGAGTKTRELDLYRSKADNANQNLFIHFLQPADIMNTTYLILEKNRVKDKWIYLSSFKKTRKIVSKDNSSSFVSSDFTYEDLDTIHADDYTTGPVSEETVGGDACWTFEATKKDLSESGYSKMTVSVSKEKLVPLRVLLFDKASGEQVKTLEVLELKKVQEIWTAYATRMTDHKNGSNTKLELVKVEYDLDLPAETFTKRNMEK